MAVEKMEAVASLHPLAAVAIAMEAAAMCVITTQQSKY